MNPHTIYECIGSNLCLLPFYWFPLMNKEHQGYPFPINSAFSQIGNPEEQRTQK